VTDLVETERVRKIWQKLAPRYDRDIGLFERLMLGRGREWVCGQASGEVLEIGVGTGRNFEHYPSGVQLTGIDFSPEMLGVARRRAERLGFDADLRLGDAQALEFPDQRFDTVVCTLALCSIPDDGQAVHDAKRILRPGGRFLAVEHVGSPIFPVRVLQAALDWLAVRFQGDHLLREPIRHLNAEGFEIIRLERSRLGLIERVAARKPGAGPLR
jgi:ubiquinone/menaquinone biosynthesis C-methylase UbiE